MKKILALLFLFALAWESKGQVTVCGFPDYVEGEMYRKAGQYEKALKEFAKSIKREPHNYKYLYSIAITLYQMKNLDSALVVADKAISLNPNYNIAVYTLKSRIYQQKGNLDSAAIFIEKAYLLQPDNESLMKATGTLFCKANRINDGITYLEMYMERKPKDYESYHILSIAYKRQGNMDKALEYRSLYLKMKPKGKPMPAGG